MIRYKNILVAIDTRQKSHPIVDEAVEIAKRNDATLKIVDVVPDFPLLVRLTMKDHAHVRELVVQEKQQELDRLGGIIKDAGVQVSTKVLLGKTSTEIIREVLRGEHDLVLRVAKGEVSRRKGFFGQTGIQLLRRCPCAVWLVSPLTGPQFNHVLGCVDTLSDNKFDLELNDNVFELAKSVSEYQGGKFSMIHSWSIWNEHMLKGRMPSGDFEELEKKNLAEARMAMSRFLKRHETSLENDRMHVVKGEAGVTISNFVRDYDVDLLVMGTVGRSGVAGLLMGNTAEQILDHVHCSVLALKPGDFVSPVKLEE